ncbi:MAG: hypothetical protein IPM16_00040 [Chloroflexi bacterium]|nr:hypothetical protein [Chloroflexota bacterium]
MEKLRYHTVDELQTLSLSELQALWELVPTERQRAYKTAYEREVRTAGAVGSDQLERKVAGELLQRYATSALIPIGSRWARTPGRVQDAARQNVVLDAPEDEANAASGKPSRAVVLGIGLAALLFVVMLVSRLGGGSPSVVADMPPTETLTPTPAISPTPTPLALESQDDVIQGSDGGREVAYPVSLQVILPDDSAPRLWVVQRRRVQASEWRYDDNPDTASSVSGMSVRPVIGIPWSDENAAYFDQIGGGTRFQLTMNTGAILTFEFDDKRAVRRSETDIFRQVSPGLVLLLIGETDEQGLPTAARTLVTAHYPPEQELGRTGELIGAAAPSIVADLLPISQPTATPAPDAFSRLDVQIIRVTTQSGRLTTRFRLYNGGSSPIPITPDDIWLALGYVENPPGPRSPAEGMASFTLLPGQAADVELVWLWSGEPYGTLQIGRYQWAIQLTQNN